MTRFKVNLVDNYTIRPSYFHVNHRTGRLGKVFSKDNRTTFSGNPKAPTASNTDRFKYAFSKAFEASVKPLLLVRDSAIGMGLAIAASFIPPHIHGAIILPLYIAANSLGRAIHQFYISYKNPNPIEIEKAKKTKDSGNWVF